MTDLSEAHDRGRGELMEQCQNARIRVMLDNSPDSIKAHLGHAEMATNNEAAALYAAMAARFTAWTRQSICDFSHNGTSTNRPSEFLAWARDIFGPVAMLRSERLMRFIEEAIELAQADGMDRCVLDAITDRVYAKPHGLVSKEIGQAALCLEGYAALAGLSCDHLAEAEWQRVQGIPREEWQRRHAAKQAIGIALPEQQGRKAETNAAVDADLQECEIGLECEHCGSSVDITSMTMMSDRWFCQPCFAELQSAVAACEATIDEVIARTEELQRRDDLD